MRKFWYILLWLLVSVVFGLLQLIWDYGTKYLNNINFNVDTLIVGGGLLFFSSAFVIPIAFESWVNDRARSNPIRFTFVHIVWPIILLMVIVIIYSSASNLPKTLSPTDQQKIFSRLAYGNLVVVIASLAYGLISKIEQPSQV